MTHGIRGASHRQPDNAQLSTGPRSVEGKAIASRNSFKLGITSQSMIIPGEDPDVLDRLTASYERQF